MFKTIRRQRSGQIHLILVSLLFAVFGLLTYSIVTHRDRFEGNQEAMADLGSQEIVAEIFKADELDWPGWMGPHRDGISSEEGLSLDWPKEGPKELWRAEVGAGFSSVAVAAGRAYTAFQSSDKSEEVVICWDAATGHELWKRAYECRYQASDPSHGIGPRSTPMVEGNRVYTVGFTGILHCLDALTGAVLWRHDLLEETGAKNLRWGVSFSPLIEGDLIITNPGGPGGKGVVAFNKITGIRVWTAGDDPAGYSSPIAVTAAGRRQIIVFTGNGVISLAPQDGALYWRVPWETNFQVNTATPLFFHTVKGNETQDYLFISSGYDQGCCLIQVIADSGGAPQIREVYRTNRMRNHVATSVRHGDYLYGFDDTRLTCLEIATGKRKWSQSGFIRGSVILADDHLIILGEEGQLAAALASPEKYQQVAYSDCFKDGKKRYWTPPSLAQGRLYLRDESKVVCYQLKEPTAESKEKK